MHTNHFNHLKTVLTVFHVYTFKKNELVTGMEIKHSIT